MAGGDLAAVVALHRAVFPRHSSARFLASALYPTYLSASASGIAVVALGPRGPVGFCVGALDDARFHRALLRAHPGECLLASLRNLAAGDPLHAGRLAGGGARLHFAAVAAEARGGGVGRRLLERALDRVRAAGCSVCRVRLHRDHADWRRLHERLGFRLETEERAGPFAVYRLDLDPLSAR